MTTLFELQEFVRENKDRLRTPEGQGLAKRILSAIPDISAEEYDGLSTKVWDLKQQNATLRNEVDRLRKEISDLNGKVPEVRPRGRPRVRKSADQKRAERMEYMRRYRRRSGVESKDGKV